MTSPNEARFLLVKVPIQNDKGIHEEWIIAEALQMETVFGLASHAVVNKPLSSFHLFTPTYQRILCTITNMNCLVMCSTESTAQVPASMEIPTVPQDNIYYSSDSSGNEYSSSASGSSYLRTPLSSSPASSFYHSNTVRDNNNHPNNQLEIALINSLAQHQLPVSQKSLIMEGYHYIFLSNKTHFKILPMQVQVVDVDENQKMIVATPYQKVCSVIFHIATGKILQSHDTEPVFVTKPANINDLLPEQSLHDLLTAQPPFRKKLIGKRHTGEQILLSTRTDGGIDPNLPQDSLLTTFTEITRWMVPLVVVTHNLLIVEYNTFFQDVFGFCSDWKKRPLTDFLKKDDRYGFVFTERNSNIQIPVRFEKLEPAFTVHNWHHGLAWYAIVPLNLPDCWVQYTPQIDDYVADTQLASDVFSGFSKLSENKVTVKLISVASPLELSLFQRLLELRHHPNIAPIEGVFLRDHVAFVVARTPGKPLSKILEAQIHVQHPDHAIAVLVRLVSALWFCHHEKRIAHGSLSFENVLVDDKWNPYLTGFGGRSTIDANAERFREDIRQLHSIFLALLSGMAKPPQAFFEGTFMYHSVEIRELVGLLHNPQCTLKDILSHPAVQNFVKNHNFKLTFY